MFVGSKIFEFISVSANSELAMLALVTLAATN